MTVKEQAIMNLCDFHRIAENLRITFFLMDGTLLGAIRDGDFCPGDEDDLDVGILDADYDTATKALTKELENIGFRRFKDLVLHGRVEGFGIERGPSHFDIIRVNHHSTRQECYNVGRRRVNGETQYLAFVYHSKHHDSFEEIEFYGMKFKVPADPHGFLTERYGDWHTEIRRPNFAWYEQSNRASIREDYDRL